jgi:uncharacterized membrane protein
MIGAMIRLILIALLLAAAAPAHAELSLCNRTSYVLETAIGLEQRNTMATRGWFRIVPGQCARVLEEPIETELVYVHARTPPVYGTAPLPQGGHAELCINQQNFVLANARGCSNPVRFTAIKPSVTEKGPTANLAEEADYDYTQARLAGIQRLLVISGYDANPIDGVQGSKTTAALNKFLADRKLPADAASGADFFDVLLKAALSPEGFGFSWCNETNQSVMASLGLVEMGAVVTRGWYRVEPGKCVRPDIRGGLLKVYSYAEAVDNNGRAIKRGGKTVAWGGNVELCTRDGKFELSDHKDCVARGLNQAGFAAVDLSGQSAVTVRFKDE